MDIPSLIIIAYFFLTLLVSFLCRRRNTELQRLLVAPQQLGLVLTVPLIFSGLFGGSTITGTVASAFAGGVSSAWYLLGTAVGCLLFLLLVFRFYRAVAVVKHSGSIPDAFAYRFDERTRVLMVLVIVITNSIALSTIPLSTAAIISKITGLSSDAAGWLCCIVLIVMALLSGLKGVAAMNMIHTFFMFLGLVVMLVPSLRSAGGFAGLSAALPESYFSFGSGGFWSVAAVLLGAVLAIMTSPLAFMSVVSSTKPKIAKNALRICAVLILPFAACLVLIGMCCRVIVPEGSANAVLFDVAQSFNPACYVLIGMSVLAATFSTAPASLLSIITTLNNDIYCKLRKNASQREQKIFVNAGVVVWTVIWIMIGKNAASILGQLTGATQIKSVASVILLISLYWKRVDRNSGFYSLLTGSVVAMGWHLAGNPFGIQPLWPSLAISLVLLVILTLLASAPVSESSQAVDAIFKEYDALPAEKKYPFPLKNTSSAAFRSGRIFYFPATGGKSTSASVMTVFSGMQMNRPASQGPVSRVSRYRLSPGTTRWVRWSCSASVCVLGRIDSTG